MKIGDTIYIIYGLDPKHPDAIEKVKVEMIGEYSFIHNFAFDNNRMEYCREPLYFGGEGRTWFTNLDDAKRAVLSKTDGTIKELEKGKYWELFRK